MSNAETIKEFLVALGFKVDESSFKKFDQAIGISTRGVVGLGLATVAAGAATEAFVAKMAASLDRLYFASKRTGSSAEEINAFSYAIGQLGGTAEGAQNTLKNLAQYMRENYAGGLLTQVLGVDPKHLNNVKKVVDDLFKDGNTLKNLRANGQEQLMWSYIHQIGIDNDTANARLDPEYATKEAERIAMLKEQRINEDELTKQGHEFNNQLKKLDESFFLLAELIEGHLAPVVAWLNDLIIKTVGLAGRLPDGSFRAAGVAIGGAVSPPAAMAYLLSEAGGIMSDAIRIKYGFPLEKAAGNDNTASSSVMAKIQGYGWDRVAAAGMAANLTRESGLNPWASGDNGQAFGIGQWHPDRQADFAAWAGHDIHGSTLDEQLAFMNYELTKGKYQQAGAALRGATNPFESGQIVSGMYEKPGDAFGEATLRGNMANELYAQPSGGATFNTTAHININTADNPSAVGRAAHQGVYSATQDLSRNVVGNTQ